MINARLSRSAQLGALLIGLCWGPAFAQADVAGEVMMVTGRGTATAADGSVRSLAKGDRVYSGEILNAGPSSFVNIKFTDGGYTLLRPNTRFAIEDYAYPPGAGAAPATPAPPPVAAAPVAPAAVPGTRPQPPTGSSRAFFRLLKGGFRAVTGLVGKINRENYLVNTPVATIGIRGTDITVVDCDLVCQTDPVIFAALQNLPAGTSALGASILIVNSGEAFITNCRRQQQQGDRSVEPVCQTNTAGAGGVILSLENGDQIVLDEVPRFIQRDPLPAPETCGV